MAQKSTDEYQTANNLRRCVTRLIQQRGDATICEWAGSTCPDQRPDDCGSVSQIGWSRRVGSNDAIGEPAINCTIGPFARLLENR